MEQTLYNNYVEILRSELVPALGCTEPIAIAYAAAKARETLGCMPESMEIRCSGNIIKNVKGVTVPNSGGLKGIDVAAVLGIVGGDAGRGLEVLQTITQEHIDRAKELVSKGFCKCGLIEGVENLYIVAAVRAGEQDASVEIKTKHTHITKITKNGEILFTQDDCATGEGMVDKSLLNVREIIQFADELKVEDVAPILDQQVEMNTAIAKEGLSKPYGAQVGQTLLKYYDKDDVRVRAKAMAAAGSDARMSGCALPVVINSGSGNQGMTVSLPIVEYAKDMGADHGQLCRALALGNLIAILQKRYIGSLSAFCGAVCAATGAASGITYLHGGRYDEISKTITNTLANVGGIVCDGAKPSCAAKIAESVDAAILGYLMGAKEGNAFGPGEGLVKENVEETIESIGRMGREGMKPTDVEILNIMIEQ